MNFKALLSAECNTFSRKVEVDLYSRLHEFLGRSDQNEMATRMRFEDRLEGASNFSPWKERITLLLEVNEVWEITNTNVASPTVATLLAAHKKKYVNARRLILYGVKDHILPLLSTKNTTREMWEALTKLYQSDNQNRKMVSREKLKSTKMTKFDSVTSYLAKITQIRDELVAVGEKVEDLELVRIALNGFSKPWGVFVWGIVARENLPNWERLWDDFIHEEMRTGFKHEGQQKNEGKENLAFASKGKGKAKKGYSIRVVRVKRRRKARSNVFHVTNLGTMQMSVRTGRKTRGSPRWLLQQKWSSQRDSRRTFPL